jgi:hypothetical protein
MDRPTENPASKAPQHQGQGPTSRPPDTDIRRLSSMWKAPTPENLSMGKARPEHKADNLIAI